MVEQVDTFWAHRGEREVCDEGKTDVGEEFLNVGEEFLNVGEEFLNVGEEFLNVGEDLACRNPLISWGFS